MKTRTRRLYGFHPEGKDEPNSIYYMRGRYWKEVRENSRKLLMPDEPGSCCAVVMLPEGASLRNAGYPSSRYCFSRAGKLFTGVFPWKGHAFNSESECFLLHSPVGLSRLLGTRAYVKRAMSQFCHAYGAPVIAKTGPDELYISYKKN